MRSVNLHKLTGDRKGFWAMTINGPWRICFRFRNGDAAERILKREMKIRNLSANRLALALRLPSGRITDILNGKRGISADTALRLGRYFGNSSRFWANLQTAYDLAKAEREIGAKISSEVLTAA